MNSEDHLELIYIRLLIIYVLMKIVNKPHLKIEDNISIEDNNLKKVEDRDQINFCSIY